MFPILVVTTLLLSFTIAYKECPKCGSMEVPYPLSTSQDCGLPNYKLSCDDEGTLHFLSKDNFAYEVLSINPKTDRLIIQPPEVQQNTCLSSDFSFMGLKIADTSPFNISKNNYVMLFNCSDRLPFSPLNCSSTSPCNVFKKTRLMECEDKLCCSYLKDASMTSRQIRVRVEGCTAYTSIVDFKPDQSVDEWNFGIEIQWLPPN